MNQDTSALIAQVMPVFMLVSVVSGGVFQHVLQPGGRLDAASGPPEQFRPTRRQMTWLLVPELLFAELLAVIGGGKVGGLSLLYGSCVWVSFAIVLILTTGHLTRSILPTTRSE